MKIIVFSDSHRQSKIMRGVMLDRSDAELFVHLGDGNSEFSYLAAELGVPTFAVRGNCDLFTSGVPDTATLELGKYRIMLTHGHLFSAKTSLSALIDEGRERRADLVLFGHTHAPLEKTVEQDGRYMTLFNPGSIGMSGSYGVVDLTDHGILCGIADGSKYLR